jgi:uncharacterized protein (DUF2252 family)
MGKKAAKASHAKAGKPKPAGKAAPKAPARMVSGSASDRRDAGKRLRDTVSRADHGLWKPPADRRDPVMLLEETNVGRIPHLVPIRFGRMARSPFDFYRGAAALMAADLAHTAATGLRVQACGDAHLMNFGGFATPERNIIFDINDLDETLPAPWEWDLKRLAASIVIAARHLDLTESDAARATIATVCSYREKMADYAAMPALDMWYNRIDMAKVIRMAESDRERARLQRRVDQAQEKSAPENLFPKLAEHRGGAPRIKDEPPLIYHPDAEFAPGIENGYRVALDQYRESLPDHVKALFDRYRLCDVAFKVVGVGSVGTQCAVALFMDSEDSPLFLQVKEARESVLAPFAGASAYANNGARVVAGQRLMQSASDMFLGWSQAQNGRHIYFRQLRDAKVSALVETFDAGMLRSYGRLCGWALARSHARTGDAAMMAGYMGSGETFDEAVCEFAMAYADQNTRDYRSFVQAIRDGRVAVATDI